MSGAARSYNKKKLSFPRQIIVRMEEASADYSNPTGAIGTRSRSSRTKSDDEAHTGRYA